YRQVFGPKVYGSWQLGQAKPEWLVCFSSVAAVLGPAGQSNHAAANVFEDMLCKALAQHGVRATSVGWGTWSQVGAAAELGATARVSQHGIGQITPRAGAQVFAEL